MQDLPINQILPELKSALRDSVSAVLSSPPGSGKTTLVPLAMLDEPWLNGKKILVLEPRRLAARASATRMAQLLNERVGETVGYQVKLDRKISSATRIEVLTEGILTRKLQQDQALEGVGLVIFDEFHERSLHADLALALSLESCDLLRDDLRLLVMSATLDTGAVSRLMNNAPVVLGEGRSYPVELIYQERDSEKRIVELTTGMVKQALANTAGDLLVFLPGVGEIRQLTSRLEQVLDSDIALCPLYGDLSPSEQDRALRPISDQRRVVIATSIAETSLTIEGIHTVVDSGQAKRPKFNPNSGLTRLETVKVSRASADQRAGRAGRLGPGVCYRLWSESMHQSLEADIPPEMLAADLAPLALELALWGADDPDSMKWLTSPPAGAFAQARDLLKELDALDSLGRISPMGRKMASVPLHPRLAHMLVRAARSDQVEQAADIAALLSERDILPRDHYPDRPVDIELRLQLLNHWRQKRSLRQVNVSLCRRVDRVSKQLKRIAPLSAKKDEATLSAGGLLAMAYPDRIAQRRAGGMDRFQLANGRGSVLPEGDLLGREPWLVAAQMDAGRSDGRIFLAASLTLDEIHQVQDAKIEQRQRVEWDARSNAVIAREEEQLGKLVLNQTTLDNPDSVLVTEAMLTGVGSLGLGALPWSDEARNVQARVESLRHWQPGKGWPNLSDTGLSASLEQWLPAWLDGISRKEHLKKLNLLSMLKAELSWEQQQQLDQIAPTHIQVPSGSRKRVDYRPGEPPVLAVRLQEMFGSADTPTVCNGKVQVMLHLLSPAQRPIQVTQDLKGFWERTYPEVKKELKGRYPKHHWPDDPWSAQPTARAKPRKK
ncbi:MAG: ATP-dependent helicase HrpB [Gammaproteobacteria bacterium]|nr:ATP-dependent helicase HrpB [Gammaproteobacteria bacterium]